MEIKNINEKKNLVFDRKEIEATLLSEIVPSNKEVMSALAKKLSVPEEAIKINGIYGKFGVKEFTVKANIYKSKEEKNQVERKTKKEVESEKKEVEEAKQKAQEAKEAKNAAKEKVE
jgi:ribosomal protein S24E